MNNSTRIASYAANRSFLTPPDPRVVSMISKTEGYLGKELRGAVERHHEGETGFSRDLAILRLRLGTSEHIREVTDDVLHKRLVFDFLSVRRTIDDIVHDVGVLQEILLTGVLGSFQARADGTIAVHPPGVKNITSLAGEVVRRLEKRTGPFRDSPPDAETLDDADLNADPDNSGGSVDTQDLQQFLKGGGVPSSHPSLRRLQNFVGITAKSTLPPHMTPRFIMHKLEHDLQVLADFLGKKVAAHAKVSLLEVKELTMIFQNLEKILSRPESDHSNPKILTAIHAACVQFRLILSLLEHNLSRHYAVQAGVFSDQSAVMGAKYALILDQYGKATTSEGSPMISDRTTDLPLDSRRKLLEWGSQNPGAPFSRLIEG